VRLFSLITLGKIICILQTNSSFLIINFVTFNFFLHVLCLLHSQNTFKVYIILCGWGALIRAELIKTLHIFHGMQRFITTFTKTHQWSPFAPPVTFCNVLDFTVNFC